MLIRSAILDLSNVSARADDKVIQQYRTELHGIADALDDRMREIIKEMEEEE